MNNEFIDRILHFWSFGYYMQGLVFICCITSLIRLYTSQKEHEHRNLFMTYLVSVLILFGGGNIFYAVNLFSTDETYRTISTANYLFNAIEAYVFFKYFLVVIQNKIVIKLIKNLLWMTIAGSLFGIINGFLTPSPYVVVEIEGIFTAIHLYTIAIPCMYYFFEVYKLNQPLIINQTLKIFSILSYSIISIPILSIGETFSYFHNISKAVFALHYFFLSLVCTFLSLNISSVPTLPISKLNKGRNTSH